MTLFEWGSNPVSAERTFELFIDDDGVEILDWLGKIMRNRPESPYKVTVKIEEETDPEE